ncbi:hypothetical protein CALCODRAFT_516921 [Calocera cornea HHB12733]|uniref:Uncharacterized protein n=1 Tax=Calocera cornea HHB12733 TaxID=1353952 RepID=A0A165GMJ8_9BASI|nr:hypothetical protein CALCODRAFT_516921 [Calocera cornea HHB12733]
MGLFTVDWNKSSRTRHTTRTRPLTPTTKKQGFFSRIFNSRPPTRSRSRTRSMARPAALSSGRTRPTHNNGSGLTTHTRRTTRTSRRTRATPVVALPPGSPSTGRSSRSTAFGQPRRRTGLFDSMLGRSRHHSGSTSHGGAKLAPAGKGKPQKRLWLHPRHQRAPTPHTGLGDKVIGAVTGDEKRKRHGQRKSMWARNVRVEERGRRGRPLYT